MQRKKLSCHIISHLVSFPKLKINCFWIVIKYVLAKDGSDGARYEEWIRMQIEENGREGRQHVQVGSQWLSLSL